MRVLPFALGFLLLTAVGAAAQLTPLVSRYPEAPDSHAPHLRLPQSDVFFYRDAPRADESDADIQARDARPSQDGAALPDSVTVGAFRVGMDNDGPRGHFAQIELENTHIMGGNISGTFDGRGAALRLSWPIGN